MQPEQETQEKEVTIVKKPVEIFDLLTDADYARLCRDTIEQENIIADCILAIEEVKTAMKKPREDAQRKIETFHNTIVAGKERREIPCELHFIWKEGRVEYWRIDTAEPKHIETLDRPVTDDERKLRLPISVMIKITGNANSHTVMLSGKELVVLEAFREIPISQNHFKWGDESPETRQLAAAILLKFLPKEEAEKLIDKFSRSMLGMVPGNKDLSLALDMERWILENQSVDTTESTREADTKKKSRKQKQEESQDHIGSKSVLSDFTEGSDQ